MTAVCKKCLAYLCVLALLCGTVSVAGAAASVPEVYRYGRAQLSKMPNAAALLYVYDALAAGAASAQREIWVYDAEKAIPHTDAQLVYQAVFRDYPEYFWLESGFSYSFYQNGQLAKIRPNYTESAAQREQISAQMEAIVRNMLLGTAGKSNYEISKILHDRLAKQVEYVFNAPDNQSANSALVNKQTVCAGYARAYQLLLLRAGIPAWYVTGEGVNSTGQPEPHAWTLLQLDGVWCYTDLTWDDVEWTAQNGDKRNDILYQYLHLSEAEISKNHTMDEYSASMVPQATAADAWYYNRNPQRVLQLSAAQPQQIAELLLADNFRTRLYIPEGTDAFLAWLQADNNRNLWAIAAACGIDGGFSYSWISGGGAEILFDIDTNLKADLMGDMTGDGELNFVDFERLLYYAFYSTEKPPEAFRLGDLNADTALDLFDVAYLELMISGFAALQYVPQVQTVTYQIGGQPQQAPVYCAVRA